MELYEIPKQLDEATLKVARKELNEKDAKQVAVDIQYIRDWILKQDYMKSRTDDDFILAFLRFAKFSYSRTQELIKNYWTHRTEMKDLFFNRSFSDDSVLMELADAAITVVLPQPDPEGRRILIQRPGFWDCKKFDFDDMSKYIFSCLDVLCQDPRVQINGLVVIADMTGLTPAHAAEMSPNRAQKFIKTIQDTLPIRVKAIHYYNYPKIFDALFSLMKMFMKEKLKKRLHLHGSDLSAIHKHIPKQVLPKDYNGTLDTIAKINESWSKYVQSNQGYLESLENYKVDLAKMNKTTEINNNQVSKTSVSLANTSNLAGTFRKLNVD